MAKEEEKKEGEEAKKGGKMKLIIMVLPLVILVAAAGWFFFLRPKGDAGAIKALPEPVPGAVVALDPITVNLSGSHFLKLGMAIQPTKAAKELDGSKALDLAISQFSGDTIENLSDAKGREEAKTELVARVKLAYLPEGTDFAVATQQTTAAEATAKKDKETENGAESEGEKISTMSGAEVIKLASKLTVQPDVYDVYFTEFVMQ